MRTLLQVDGTAAIGRSEEAPARHRCHNRIALFLLAIMASPLYAQESARKGETSHLAPPLEWFDQWMAETNERVPEFDAMRSMAGLPPLLEFYDGRPVSNVDDWQLRRDEIKRLLCKWILGSFPDEVPDITKSEVLVEQRERGVTRREVRLTYDTQPPVSIDIELMIPEGKGPFPVFMTQTTHRRVGLIGVSRGYLVCIYPGADSDDQTEGFLKACPDADWGRIARRAWLGSRVLDYLVTLDVVNRDQIAITGHSRNGKQSLIAAAFDDRITAVVSSSSGTGGSAPFRFVGEDAYEESVEFMSRQPGTADWFHPRIRLFTGREDKLPIDMHGLLGLIAPRACLLSVGLNDGVATTFANERAYIAAREVYRFLRRPDLLRIRYRPSTHEWDTETAHAYFDWYDHVFGRGDAVFPETLIHAFDWQAWRDQQDARHIKPPVREEDETADAFRRRAIEWGLGEAPPQGIDRGGRYGRERPHVALRIGRDYNGEGVERIGMSFGEYVPGHFYHKPGAAEPMPVVIWLHPFTYSKGTVGEYVRGERIYHTLARRGIGVFTYDQVGFGHRLLEGSHFYERYPEWSRLGKMVADVRAALDCLLDAEGRFAGMRHPSEDMKLPRIDADRIYIVGYSLGGMVGLHAAALDGRIAGVGSFCGFTPMRTDTDAKPTGGIRRWLEWHAIQPRLGLFAGEEADIPYDFDDVLACIAPRPCLIVSPLHDRHADHADIARCVDTARSAWQEVGYPDRLTHLSPIDYNRFEEPQHEIFIDWLDQQLGKAR